MPFVNLYRSGWFHRKGKPNTYDAHPGDLYPTAQLALQDIDPKARDLYIGTFPVLINGSIYGSVLRSDYDVVLNDSSSQPVPLPVSRSEIIQARNAVPKTPVLAEGHVLSKDFAPPSGLNDHQKAVLRAELGSQGVEWRTGEEFAADTALETSEAEAVHIDPPNVVAFRSETAAAIEQRTEEAREVLSRAYRPVHGGYPDNKPIEYGMYGLPKGNP